MTMADTSTITPSDEVQTTEPEATVQALAETEPASEKEDELVHPYLEEIMKCPNDWQLEKQDPIPYKSLEDTPFTIVDTKELLEKMMAKLKMEREIAVAVKGSNYRSFRKKNCLIQIATRSEVFIVDTIELKEDIKMLNEVFTNKDVLKVGHTKDVYIRDFQNDLSLYVVNMFCLPIAGKMLRQAESEKGKKRMGRNFNSLQVLLKEQCGMDYPDSYKDLQDWHARPLTDEYVKCAQMSVQYLLYIYDKFRNMLIEQNHLEEVYKQSNEMCKVVWSPAKNVSAAQSGNPYLWLYKKLGSKSKGKELNKVQIEVFRLLYEWRHTTAEKHDEGHTYLLKDQAIYDIANALPENVEGIRECLSPDTLCSLLEESLDHISELIVKKVKSLSGTPNAADKVSFNPPAKLSDAGKKRKQNGPHPYFGGRGAPHFGRPRYPIKPMGFAGPPMGFAGRPMGFVGRPMGFAGRPIGSMRPPMGSMRFPMGSMRSPMGSMSSAMGPMGIQRGIRMHMHPRPFSW